MDNKKAKQMICDVERKTHGYRKVWFSDECPIQCVGRTRSGNYAYIKLHCIEGGEGIRFESIVHHNKVTSIGGNNA